MPENISFDLSIDYTSCKPILERVERGQTEVTPDEALQMLTELSDVREKLICAQVLHFQDTKEALSKLRGQIGQPQPESASREGVPPPPPEGNEVTPLAPTTAFNIMRLVQLGYFPKDYAAILGDEPNTFHKGVQMFYVLPGKLGEWARTKANTAFQKKYDRDAAYKDFMLDLTKQMDAELKDWFKQNKLSDKANIDAARQSLDAMKASFTAGNNKEAFSHFDTLTETMGMRVNGKWHEKTAADLAVAQTEQEAKTTKAEARVQKAKDQKTLRESQLKGVKDDLKAKKAAIDTLYANEGGHGIDPRFNADGVKISDIDAEIKKLGLEKVTLEKHSVALSSAPHDVQTAVAGRDFTTIQSNRDTVGYAHATRANTFFPVGSQLNTVQGEIHRIHGEIEDLNKEGGSIKTAGKALTAADTKIETIEKRIPQIEQLLAASSTTDEMKAKLNAELKVINGDPHSTPLTIGSLAEAKQQKTNADLALEQEKAKLESKQRELRIHEQNKSNLLLQSEQNKIAFDWYNKRITRINQITEQLRVYNDLKPLVEARNKTARKLELTEKSIKKADETTKKREQLAREVHATASPIYDALDKLGDPSISQSEKLAMNEELNKLLAQKNPQAERIERLLQGTQTERNQALRELKMILDTRGKGVDFFKTSLDGIESKIKGLQGEATRIMTEYDKQAGTGDVEALRKKMEVEIGKINTEIERYNADARVKYGAAAATLTPVQLESLHLQTKLGAFFGNLNKSVQFAEGLGSKPVASKAMRGLYGAMTIAGIGQLGVTGVQSGGKQMALDAADMGIGFVPVVGGVYDIIVGTGQFIKGSEIVSFDGQKAREVSKTDALKRIGFGVLGLVPIAGQMFKAAAKGEKLVEVARKVSVVERAADVTGKVLILNEAKNLGVALYDATGSVVAENGGIKKTAESLYTNTRLPVNQ